MLDRLSYPTTAAMATLGIKKTTFWKLVKAGSIEVIRIGGKTVVPAENLDKLVAELQRKSAANSLSTGQQSSNPAAAVDRGGGKR